MSYRDPSYLLIVGGFLCIVAGMGGYAIGLSGKHTADIAAIVSVISVVTGIILLSVP